MLVTSGQVMNGRQQQADRVPLTDGGKSSNVTFTFATAGVYNFRCQVHPTEMLGKFFVVAPSSGVAPGSAAASGTPSAGGAAVPAPTQIAGGNPAHDRRAGSTSGAPVGTPAP